MNMVLHTDATATQPAIHGFVPRHDGQEMDTGPLDGLGVLDLVGCVVIDVVAAVVSASGALLADASRKLTDLGALLGSVWTVRQHVADDSSAADDGQPARGMARDASNRTAKVSLLLLR
jgi:hypothetical protein